MTALFEADTVIPFAPVEQSQSVIVLFSISALGLAETEIPLRLFVSVLFAIVAEAELTKSARRNWLNDDCETWMLLPVSSTPEPPNVMLANDGTPSNVQPV